MTEETWKGAILGAVLGSIVIPLVQRLIECLKNWWFWSRPPRKVLGAIADQNEKCLIFLRDFIVSPDTKLFSVTPRIGVGVVPNVSQLWPDVEGKAIAFLFSIFGQIDKTDNIELIKMSEDTGQWNANIIVLGAQAQKSYDFYANMEHVGYRMDGTNIYDNISDDIISREDGYGYGLILKCKNQHKVGGKVGVGILIGGYGVLGTAAASYYFKEHIRELGSEFGDSYFSIVVRAPISAGEQAATRLKNLDKSFNS